MNYDVEPGREKLHRKADGGARAFARSSRFSRLLSRMLLTQKATGFVDVAKSANGLDKITLAPVGGRFNQDAGIFDAINGRLSS